MKSLEGRRVLLTGATRGIGRALALRLAGQGAELALCGRDREALDGVVSEVVELAPTEPIHAVFDLADAAATLDFYRRVRDDRGAPEIVINNAGFNPRKAPVSEVEIDELDLVLHVNLRAPFILMREAAKDMADAGGGTIVNVLSTVCHFANETMGAYTAAKAGLRALTDVFRKEVRSQGVRVTSVYPGGTDTEFRPRAREDYMRPESVAEAIERILTLPDDVVPHDFTFRPMVETNF